MAKERRNFGYNFPTF